jgi:glycosyltransferase involved in cell wall biosynthesis
VNILFVSTTRAGGSGLSQHQLAARLIDRGHRVAILADSERGHQATRYLYKRQVNLSTKLRGTRWRPPLLRLQRPFGAVARRRIEDGVPVYLSPVPENAFRRVRRLFPPDVVVASSIDRVTWRRLRAQLRALGIPSVLYLREAVAQGHLTISDAAPDLLLANAESLAESARAAGFRCAVVPSVVEVSRALVSSSRQRVLLVNPMRAYGGDLVWPIARARPDIPFVIQESLPLVPEDRAAVVAEAAELPNVEFRERTRDVRAVYRDARILLVPHQMDNRPRVVAEAQANGIPVVASAYPGLAEAVGPGGVLVDPSAAPDAWVAALADLWDHPARYGRLAAAARSHASRPDIDPAAVAARIDDLISQLVVSVRAGR